MGPAFGVNMVLAVGHSAALASVTVADLVTALATAVTAAVSVALGSFAFLQLRDARKVRHDETRPYVLVDFEVEQHMVYLHLQNLGRTAARNLSFSSSPSLESSMDRGDRHGPSRFLDREWPSFPPGKEITSLFDSAITMLADDSNRPMRYEVTASYDDPTGIHYDDVSVLDIESYRGRHFTTEKTVDDVAKALEKIRDGLEAIQHRRSALVVYTKAIDEVMSEEKQEYEERTARAKPQPQKGVPEVTHDPASTAAPGGAAQEVVERDNSNDVT